MPKNKWIGASALFVVLGILLIALGLSDTNRQVAKAQPTATLKPTSFARPTSTPEPLIPTRTPTVQSSSKERVLPVASVTPAPSIAPINIPDIYYEGRPRWGIGVAIGPITRYNIDGLRLGWYLDWKTELNPPRLGNIEYAQMVRLSRGVPSPNATALAETVRANPGGLWLIGNEPDVRWQDNVEPAAYARLYHQAYSIIKDADATARVAIGGVTQPTPLRMRYLEMVLAAYRAEFKTDMPIDVWNIHNFILREERNSWGVDIPPGITDDQGILYEIDDSGNLDAFKKQIIDFRRWMAEHGYRNYPLIVSEYGIPMPEDYGFPPERVNTFLGGTFEFFLFTTDSSLGYPLDGNRLVQRWCWYSTSDITYPTGNIYDSITGSLTDLGMSWTRIVARYQ